jgi:hypothetical protein
MSDDEFMRLINGPLNHPMGLFKISRLVLALRAVVEMTGEKGEAALRAYCEAREARDKDQAC